MMMDEEARSSLMKEIDDAHQEDQNLLMQAARLKQVNLEIDEDPNSGLGSTEEESKEEKIVLNGVTSINDSQRQLGQHDLRI